MRFADILRLALGALAQQKVRTVLTTLGVVSGSFVLIVSLSLRQGVQETILREVSRFGDLRLIDVHAEYTPLVEPKPVKVEGEMGAERRKRLEAAIQQHTPDRGPYVPKAQLTPARLRELAQLPHVRSVTLLQPYVVQVELGGQTEDAQVVAARAGDESFKGRLVAGSYFSGADAREVLVSEYLLYKLGLVNEADAAAAVGRKVRLTARDYSPGTWLLDLWGKQPGEEFAIRGVLREANDDELRGRWRWVRRDADLVLPGPTAEALAAQLPLAEKYGFDSVQVEVDDTEHVKAVADQLRQMGLRPSAMLERVEVDRFIYNLVFSGMSLVAAVALAVAALGIANTMLMGVLERVREIGIMKAVGARDLHIQLIFLVEGALIGLVGGLVGLALAWGLSGPGDHWMRSLLERNTSIRLQESVFVFPLWLVLGGPAFACAMTTVAALLPARRAARVDPVAALRHE